MWSKEVMKFILGERDSFPNLGDELPEVPVPYVPLVQMNEPDRLEDDNEASREVEREE